MPTSEKDSAPLAPLVGGLLFLGVYALYVLTLAPAVTFWDSGELIAASYGLGIPHQPGYPLYCIVGRFFTLIPLGSVAFRLNLLSASFSALSVWLVYRVLSELIRARGGSGRQGRAGAMTAAFLALFMGVIRVFWAEAVVAEVYALNSFFIALLLLLYVKAARGGLAPRRYMALSGFVFGLGVVNHVSLLLYLPALTLTWALIPGMSGLRARTMSAATAAAFMLVGLSVCLYLPVRSQAAPMLDLGHPDNLSRFLAQVNLYGYLARAGAAFGRMGDIIRWAMPRDVRALVGVPAGLYIAWRLLRDDWRLYLPLVVFLASYALGISTQVAKGGSDASFGLTGKFYMPAFMLIVILVGAAAGEFMAARRLGVLLMASLGLMGAVLAYYNYRPDDCSKDFIAYDYAQNSLKTVGQDGVLFTWGDNGAFPLWYLQQVERYRDDVALIHAPLMTYGWYLSDVEKRLGAKVGFRGPYFLGENVYRVLKAAGGVRPVAYDYSTTHYLRLNMKGLARRGLLYYEGAAPPGDPWPWYVFRGVDDPAVFKGPMERNVIAIYEYHRKAEGAPPLPGLDVP